LSNKELKKEQIESLRSLVVLKYEKLSLKNDKPDAIDEVKRLLSLLIYYDEEENSHYEIVETNITSYLKEDVFLALFGYKEKKDKEGNIITNFRDILAMCLPDQDTFERFITSKTTYLDNRNFCFMALYVGYCGWEGFKKRKSIAECFQIVEQNLEDLFIKNNVSIMPFDSDSKITTYNSQEGFETLKSHFEKHIKNQEKKFIDDFLDLARLKGKYLENDKIMIEKQDEFFKLINSMSNKLISFENKTLNYLKYSFEEKQFKTLQNELSDSQKSTNKILDYVKTSRIQFYEALGKIEEKIDNSTDIIEKKIDDSIDRFEENIGKSNEKIDDSKNEIKESLNYNKELMLEKFESLKQEFLIKDSYIPRILRAIYFKFIWNKFLLFLGINKWLYKLDKNAPLGLNAEALKETVNNYIPIDFQESIVFDEQNTTYIDALGYLTHHVLKKQPFENGNVAQFFFVIATSGIGKTTLLLKLYLESRKKNIAKNNVFIIPFSKWRELYTLKKHEKIDAILLLDAIDEDFTLSSSEDLELIIDELRKITKEFSKVVITSRGEFFRKNNLLEKFNKRLSEHIDFSYQVISLCPFSSSQITTYLKKKFRRKDQLKKAKQIIQLIGKDTFHRQFLISKIDLLFDVLKNDFFIPEAKGYFLFQTMLNKWIQRERLTVQNILNNTRDKKVEAFKSTIQFCKVLAKRFIVEKRMLNDGFTFEEIQIQVQGTIDQSKILTNRTFLIRDINDKYRFSHNSILEFFSAQIAVEDEKFDNNHFKSLELDFASKMYEQGILVKIIDIKNTLLLQNFKNNIQYTIYDIEVNEYANEMRFEPDFLIDKNGNQNIYEKKEWQLFISLISKINDYKKIKGIKFVFDEDIIESNYNNLKHKRQDVLNIIKPILRFFNELICLDLSNMNLTDKQLFDMKLSHIKVLNLRRNNFEHFFIKNNNFSSINIRDNNISKIRFPENINANEIIIDYIPDRTGFDISNKFINPKEKLFLFIEEEYSELSKKDTNIYSKMIGFGKNYSFKSSFFTKKEIVNKHIKEITYEMIEDLSKKYKLEYEALIKKDSLTNDELKKLKLLEVMHINLEKIQTEFSDYKLIPDVLKDFIKSKINIES
jgi:hypothetical protein